MVGPERRGEDERDVALAEHVARLVPHAGLEAGIGDDVEAEGVAVEVRRLPGVAHEEADVVDALERNRSWTCRASSVPSCRSGPVRAGRLPGRPRRWRWRRALRGPPGRTCSRSKSGIEEDGFELFHRVAGVLGLDAVVPGEEGDPQARDAGLA